jgi:hypothetical protein
MVPEGGAAVCNITVQEIVSFLTGETSAFFDTPQAFKKNTASKKTDQPFLRLLKKLNNYGYIKRNSFYVAFFSLFIKIFLRKFEIIVIEN